jgi:hypothetical protein
MLRNYLLVSKVFILLAFVIGEILFSGCSSLTNKGGKEDHLLARVYNKSLYLSDMEGMLPDGLSSEDSLLIIKSYVQNWTRESVLLHEAERNLPKAINVDKLVNDYRASLIKNNYENILVNELLDSIISSDELQAFYEKNKEQFQLESPIVRCLFIKADLNSPDISRAQQLWNNGKPKDFAQFADWALQNAVVQHLDENSWYKVDEIGAFMPSGTITLDKIRKDQEFVLKDDNFIYFFKVLELVSRTEIAPLSYIEEQARKVILHKRKTQLLEEMKEKLYEEANRRNSVKIYQ